MRAVLPAHGKEAHRCNGPDPIPVLDAALQEAATGAGVTLTIADGQIALTIPE